MTHKVFAYMMSVSASVLLAVCTAALLGGCGLIAKQPAKIVHAGPGTPFDLQGFIDQALAAGQKRIVVPPGRYRVKPQRQCHLRLRDLKDVEILAKDVEMVCTETTLAVSIENCRDVALRGLTIDYDPLPFTQGRIVAMAPDKTWLEFEIIDGYPENLEMRIEIFDQRTEQLKVETRGDWSPFQSLGNRRYRVARGAGHRYDPKKDFEEVGDILVTNSSTAPGGQTGHALVSANCVNLVLEDIRLYASNCFSYFEHDCDGTTYRRCSIDRRPLAGDLRPRGLRRLRSSDADAFHSKHAGRGPQIIGCTAKYQGDDCVNICGEYYMVMSSEQNRVRMLSRHKSNLAVGDPVELVTYTGERLADAKVLGLEAAGKVTPVEQSFLRAQRMNQGTKESLARADTDAWTLTLDRAVELPMGSVVASMRHTGNGFLVKDCDFGFNRSRGILIKGSSGQVVGNRLTGCWMAAVLVAPEWWWLESGSSRDLVIADNRIAECREPAIDVVARGGNGAVAPSGAHRNIVIRNNTIMGSPWPNIHVTSTDQLVVEGNRLSLFDPALSRWRWEKNPPSAIVTESCDRPVVQAERIDLSAIPCEALQGSQDVAGPRGADSWTEDVAVGAGAADRRVCVGPSQ